jgi:hypothetical protein
VADDLAGTIRTLKAERDGEIEGHDRMAGDVLRLSYVPAEG